MDAAKAKPESAPMSGVVDFVRNHLAIANGLLLAAGFVVSFIDFISPALHPAAMRLIYALVAAPVALTIAAAAFPRTVERALALLGLRASEDGPGWRRPAWRFAMLLAAGMALFGAVSIAKAGSGGVIAATIPQMRDLQAKLFELGDEMAATRRGVEAANAKLDLLVDSSGDPMKEIAARGYPVNAGGIMQAIKNGDAKAVRLFAEAGVPAEYQGPMLNLMNKDNPWKQELADALKPSMFAKRDACPASVLSWDLGKDAAARLAAFARLCDIEEPRERLARLVEQDRAKPPKGAYGIALAETRERNLALLRR